MRDGRQLCQDILNSAKRVIDYAARSFTEHAEFLGRYSGRSSTFQEGRMIVQRRIHGLPTNGVTDAVLYRLCVIGEAAGDFQDFNSSRIVRAGFGDIVPTLRAFRRMRDLLIHQHWKVDLEIVWNTVETDVPALHKRLALLYPHFAR